MTRTTVHTPVKVPLGVVLAYVVFAAADLADRLSLAEDVSFLARCVGLVLLIWTTVLTR